MGTIQLGLRGPGHHTTTDGIPAGHGCEDTMNTSCTQWRRTRILRQPDKQSAVKALPRSQLTALDSLQKVLPGVHVAVLHKLLLKMSPQGGEVTAEVKPVLADMGHHTQGLQV